MKEELISNETAKLLKECGFNELCFNFYDRDGILNEAYLENGSSTDVDFRVNLEDLLDNHNYRFSVNFSAPTQSFAQRWLRETHRISVDVRLVTNLKVYDYRVVEIDKEYHNSFFDGVISPHAYPSYEGALEMGIVRALKLLKN